jgi:hypothetical protein
MFGVEVGGGLYGCGVSVSGLAGLLTVTSQATTAPRTTTLPMPPTMSATIKLLVLTGCGASRTGAGEPTVGPWA